MIDRASREVLGVARSVLSDSDLEAVLERVLESARRLTGAKHAVLDVLDESHAVPERFAAVGALHPPETSFLGVPVTVAGAAFGILCLTGKQGEEQFTECDREALALLAELAAVAIEHARRDTRSAACREDLQRTVDVLDASQQITRALGGRTDLAAILQLVATRGRALVGARSLVIEHRRGGELVVVAGAGEFSPGLIGRCVDLDGSVASGALRTGRSQRLEDEPNRARFERYGLGRLGFRARAGLVVPLVFRGHAHGVLVAVDRLEGGPGFSAEDQRLLEAFAASATGAVATAESVEAERRFQRLAAAEQERGRWARELHDETLQGLAALRLGLAAAQRAGEPEAMVAAVGQAVSQLDVDIAGLRSLITDLRPAALDELGLGAAINTLAERVRRGGLELDVSVDLAHEQGRACTRLAPELEEAVYRIAQEAFTNARKHGDARSAVIEVFEDDSTVRVSVRDDGKGFDLAAGTDGFGLLGMRERTELLDAVLAIDSAPGRGTTVTATFPAARRGSGQAASEPRAMARAR